jgi:sterol desaturase/sphingolipid hydroxylase (fatty acid hydroxylase superfamily)
VIFIPVIVAFSILGLSEIVLWQGVIWAIVGYGVWTLTEYWLHRVVFHFEPDHPLGARLHWMIHGVHHDHPNDPMRLVMPPSASIPLGLIFIAAFQLLLPFSQACMLSAGFFIGYLTYDMTHYYLHHRRPTTAVGRKLRELHMRHHFQDHDRGYGVSAPYWDKVFGTAQKSRSED